MTAPVAYALPACPAESCSSADPARCQHRNIGLFCPGASPPSGFVPTRRRQHATVSLARRERCNWDRQRGGAVHLHPRRRL